MLHYVPVNLLTTRQNENLIQEIMKNMSKTRLFTNVFLLNLIFIPSYLRYQKKGEMCTVVDDGGYDRKNGKGKSGSVEKAERSRR